MTVSGADERIHPVEDESEHWSDSLYFNVWDPASGLFLLTRMAVLPNKPGATAGVLAWQDGVPFGAYGHNLDEVPLADWDDLRIGGLRYRELEPLQSWEITLDDDDGAGNRMRLRWDGFTGVVDYRDNAERLPKAVAWGHYEQTCRVRGEMTLAGRDFTVDGVGQRDHSWGFRHWAGLREWHWVTGFVGRDSAGPADRAVGAAAPTDRSFNVFHVVQHDGTVTVNGFVHDAAADHLIVGVERQTDEAEGSRSPSAYRMTIHTEGGRSFTIEGEADGIEVPVRPAGQDQPTIVHERLMRLRTDDGLVGAGIYELLENTSAPRAGAGTQAKAE